MKESPRPRRRIIIPVTICRAPRDALESATLAELASAAEREAARVIATAQQAATREPEGDFA